MAARFVWHNLCCTPNKLDQAEIFTASCGPGMDPRYSPQPGGTCQDHSFNGKGDCAIPREGTFFQRNALNVQDSSATWMWPA
jgi:hypothetical protein